MSARGEARRDWGGLHGVVRIEYSPDTAPIACYRYRFNPTRGPIVVSRVASIGTTFTIGVDNPFNNQTVGSPTMRFLSLLPNSNYPCEIVRGKRGQGGPGMPGDVLIDLRQPLLSAPFVGLPWAGAGTPSSFPMTLANAAARVGVDFYVQWGVCDTSGMSSVGIGLTEAHEIRAGH